jgi:hypothetical protein
MISYRCVYMSDNTSVIMNENTNKAILFKVKCMYYVNTHSTGNFNIYEYQVLDYILTGSIYVLLNIYGCILARECTLLAVVTYHYCFWFTEKIIYSYILYYMLSADGFRNGWW